MGDFPAHVLILPPLAVSTLPAAIAAILWGGRGVVWVLAMALAAIVGYLTWGFGFGGIQGRTGMEGLALFLFPMWWAIGALWSGFCYLVVAAVGGLPRQRRT